MECASPNDVVDARQFMAEVQNSVFLSILQKPIHGRLYLVVVDAYCKGLQVELVRTQLLAEIMACQMLKFPITGRHLYKTKFNNSIRVIASRAVPPIKQWASGAYGIGVQKEHMSLKLCESDNNLKLAHILFKQNTAVQSETG